MIVQHRPCGDFETNCYVITVDDKDIIIDPGVGATSWLKGVLNNPIAILNTHGHFDHIWSNDELTKMFGIPIYVPKKDAFMLEGGQIFGMRAPKSTPSFLIDGDSTLDVGGIEIKYLHFPGHTPGCSCIEIEDVFFSGDFIFKNSVGRIDLPYSNAKDMRKSLRKFLALKYNKKVYPGHMRTTTIKEEQSNISSWVDKF